MSTVYDWSTYKNKKILCEDTDTHGKYEREDGGRLELCCSEPKNPHGYQILEEARKELPLEALEGAWASQHLDFALLAFRVLRKYILVVFSQLVVILWMENECIATLQDSYI